MIGGLLERVRRAQREILAILRRDELQADRQAVRVKPQGTDSAGCWVRLNG